MCIDFARLPRETMFVALPRKVDTMLPRFDAGHEHGKQTNEFAASEQPRAIHTPPYLVVHSLAVSLLLAVRLSTLN
jgi:hypothetical protein